MEEEYNFSSDDENEACVSRFYSSGSDSEDEDNEDVLQKIMERHASKSRSSNCHPGDVQPDPFEEEMADELNAAMLSLKSFGNASASSENPCSSMPSSKKSEKTNTVPSASRHPDGQYESIYFDSDEDEDSEDVKQHRKTVSDADLLYDPTLDDQDQLWMDQHRRQYSSSSGRATSAGDGESISEKRKNDGDDLPQSDAVLNCPGCLSMLCTDCQRHVTYGNQYRAMFVFNCRVDRTQLLSCPAKLTKSEIKKNKKKERQLRKMMKRKSNQNENVIPSALVSCSPRDPVTDVCNMLAEDSEKNYQPLGDNAICSRSDQISSGQNALSVDARINFCGETMEVVETMAGKPSLVRRKNDAAPGSKEIMEEECSSQDIISRGTISCSTSSSNENASIIETDDKPKHSNLLEEKTINGNSASSSTIDDEDTSCLEQKTSSVHVDSNPSLSQASSFLNESKGSSHGTKASTGGNVSNKSSEASVRTTSGVLKRSSGADSSTPSKKVRFSGETREFGPVNPVDVTNGVALLQSASEDVFHPVLCRHCNTKVAVFDKDEVYHFFNVITSY